MTDLHPDQASPSRAEAAFAFLGDLGFRLADRWVTGGKSFRHGWRLIYSAPSLTVLIQYLDQEFQVRFVRAGVEVDYRFIDRELFSRRSGLYGNVSAAERRSGHRSRSRRHSRALHFNRPDKVVAWCLAAVFTICSSIGLGIAVAKMHWYLEISAADALGIGAL